MMLEQEWRSPRGLRHFFCGRRAARAPALLKCRAIASSEKGTRQIAVGLACTVRSFATHSTDGRLCHSMTKSCIHLQFAAWTWQRTKPGGRVRVAPLTRRRRAQTKVGSQGNITYTLLAAKAANEPSMESWIGCCIAAVRG